MARLTSLQYETWLKNVPIEIFPPDRVTFIASNRFSRTWIDRKFREMIVECARTVLGTEPVLEIVIADGQPLYQSTARADLEPVREENREERSGDEASQAGIPRLASPGPPRTAEDVLPSAALKQDFTFSNFVVGPSNRLAHAAAMGVAEAPGRAYNPLFIYGGVGLGKTHLLHAVFHRLMETPRLRLTYLTSEAFTNHFIGAIERGQVEGFRRRLRSTDVLIVDDVQFISTKEQTQEEFFHTFNALIAEAKQVVISSDCSPREIPGLKERLISRFNMGLVTKIDSPSFETRVAIVLKKARARGREMAEPVAEYLANHIVTNVRELEGVLVRILGFASLEECGERRGMPITLELAQAALRELAAEENLSGTVGITEIQKAVAIFYEVKLGEILSHRRARTTSFARQVCMYLARRLTHYSLSEIGALVGGRNHATVIYAVEKIKKLAAQDPRLKADLDSITSRILGTRTVL